MGLETPVQDKSVRKVLMRKQCQRVLLNTHRHPNNFKLQIGRRWIVLNVAMPVKIVSLHDKSVYECNT